MKDKTNGIWKALREQTATYKRPSVRLFSDFSSETLKASKQWVDIVQVLTVKTLPTKNSIYSTAIHQKLEKEEQSKSKYSRMKEFMKIRD